MPGPIAYPGEPGAFAEAACRRRFPLMEAVGLAGFIEVGEAVADGRASHGVLPVRNSRAGAVPGAAEVLRDARLRVVEEFAVPIAMHCLGLPGATLDGLRIVRSHPVALAQCGRFVASIGARAVPARDTALAARAVRQGGDPTAAALGSSRAARLHGLIILAAAVQDDAGNATTFAVVERAGS